MISTEEAIERARALASRGRRALLGIAGPPGGGKSTLAQAVAAELGDRVRARVGDAERRSDQRNAELVAATQSRADVLVRIASAVADRGGG